MALKYFFITVYTVITEERTRNVDSMRTKEVPQGIAFSNQAENQL